MKRLLVISDLHCGHVAGLTPPRWQFKPTDNGSKSPTKREKWYEAQRESWEWYVRNISRFGPFDRIIVNGDAIDGRGERSGSTELITVDRMEQCDMALRCIQRAMNSKTQVRMSYGTGYHTGSIEDWENEIARDLNAEIGSHDWVDIEGWIFDYKHHIGGSGIPHGRMTAQGKDDLWNAMWAERSKQPRFDVMIRSHVHYFIRSEDAMRERVTTPALQGMGSKYGSRRCSGTVDFGFLIWECDKESISFHKVLGDLKCHEAKAQKW